MGGIHLVGRAGTGKTAIKKELFALAPGAIERPNDPSLILGSCAAHCIALFWTMCAVVKYRPPIPLLPSLYRWIYKVEDAMFRDRERRHRQWRVFDEGPVRRIIDRWPEDTLERKIWLSYARSALRRWRRRRGKAIICIVNSSDEIIRERRHRRMNRKDLAHGYGDITMSGLYHPFPGRPISPEMEDMLVQELGRGNHNAVVLCAINDAVHDPTVISKDLLRLMRSVA